MIGYLESVAGRPAIREDGHAHVLAVDGQYGQGKTYFLRRLARHLSMNHAVAFVDAWVDDLENEPLVALAATLDEALKPWASKSKTVSKNLRSFKSKAGRVAKIVGIGLAKRGVGFLITQGAAEILSDELGKSNDISRDIQKDSLKSTGSDLTDEVSNALSDDAASDMESRILRFREGREAIIEMKRGLSKIVESLEKEGMKLPITIIIDELDRCRPTYAIKLLEEIKHLFDVPGVAFVLGMHGQQLSHSVSAAYGVSFDGKAYLRRFFNRRYVLRAVQLTPLIRKLFDNLELPSNRFLYPQIKFSGSSRPVPVDIDVLINEYMISYDVSARDSFELLEILETCAALTAPHPLLMAYLLPLIIGHMFGSAEPLAKATTIPTWKFSEYSGGPNGKWIDNNIDEIAADIATASRMSDNDLMDVVNGDRAKPIHNSIAQIRFNNLPGTSYANPANYRQLIQAVERFKTD